MRLLAILLEVVFLVTALVACGDDPVGPEAELGLGEFEAAVSGSFEQSLMGSAQSQAGLFSTASDREVWILDLDDGQNEIFLRLGVSAVPPMGSYTLVPPPDPSDTDVLADSAAWFTFDIVSTDGTRGLFTSESGKLSIEETSTNEVRGRIDFQASGSAFGPLSGSATFRSIEGGTINSQRNRVK